MQSSFRAFFGALSVGLLTISAFLHKIKNYFKNINHPRHLMVGGYGPSPFGAFFGATSGQKRLNSLTRPKNESFNSKSKKLGF